MDNHNIDSSHPEGLRLTGPVHVPRAVPSDWSQDLGGRERGGFIEYFRALRRGWRWILILPTIGLLTGLIVAASQQRTYQATASLELQEINDNVLNRRELDGTAASAVAESYIQTQLRILKSRSLLESVVAKIGMPERQDVPGARRLIDRWRVFFHIGQTGKVLQPSHGTVRDYAADFASRLRIQSPDQTRIVDVTLDYPSPTIATEFVNALCEAYIAQNLDARWTVTERTERRLAKEIATLKQNLESSEEQLQQYAHRAGLIYTGEKVNLAEEQLRRLQEELSRSGADVVSKQSQYERANTNPTAALPEVLDNGPLKEYQVKLTELKRSKAELDTTLTPESPKVMKVQSQIASLEGSIEKERTNVLRRIRNEYDAGRRRHELLEAQYAAQIEALGQQSTKSAHYNVLKREADTNRQLYDSMLQKVKEYGIASALQVNHVRVIDSAVVPSAPSKPNPKWSAGLGLAAGLAAAVMLVLVRDRLACTIDSPDEAAAYLQVNELGLIPQSARLPRGWLESRSRLSRMLASGAPAVGSDLEPERWDKRESRDADSFRATFASMRFVSRNDSGCHVFLVSSASGGEGKTTTVTNLGIALAESNQRVLVIDGDLRSPALHRALGVSCGAGLSNVLFSIEEPEMAVVDRLIKPTRHKGLKILTAGSIDHPAGDLLYSPNLAILLQLLRREYDAILVDTPPLLTFPDARLIGRMSDAVVLVLRLNYTTRMDAMTARKRLLDDNIPLLGTILNGWNVKRESYGPSSYYRHQGRSQTT